MVPQVSYPAVRNLPDRTEPSLTLELRAATVDPEGAFSQEWGKHAEAGRVAWLAAGQSLEQG
jgi:hypothetical protein